MAESGDTGERWEYTKVKYGIIKGKNEDLLARRCYKRYGDKSKTRGLEDLDEGKKYRYVPCAYCRLPQ